ncbi:MAG: phosphatase PAP2 family protein [Chitinophagaceae bacterium]
MALLIAAAVIFLSDNTKSAGYMRLVPYHSKALDLFFTVFTYLGDGIVILLLAVVLLIRKKKWIGVAIIVSYALSGLLAQLAKYIHPSPRPAVFFRQLGLPFHEIPGVTLMNSMASFPSGHTTSAFALLVVLILFYPKSKWNLLWLFLAVAVGYSRIYLGNHFLADVTAGATLGIISAFGTVRILAFYSGAKKTTVP